MYLGLKLSEYGGGSGGRLPVSGLKCFNASLYVGGGRSHLQTTQSILNNRSQFTKLIFRGHTKTTQSILNNRPQTKQSILKKRSQTA